MSVASGPILLNTRGTKMALVAMLGCALGNAYLVCNTQYAADGDIGAARRLLTAIGTPCGEGTEDTASAY